MLAEDQIGGRADDPREPLASPYVAAFDAIHADPAHRLIVVETNGAILGTMQLTLLPGLLNHGAWRGQIEAVRVAAAHRSGGIGEQMIDWAVDWFRAHSCFVAQLTSNNDRVAAHRFYQRLGWAKSHAGFKLYLETA
ncbi:MAG: GNAT family N-acetyltransferase [Sphingomonas sp.]|nr:GNAT family N-acetyltransferase [Sphingomonas sp.]